MKGEKLQNICHSGLLIIGGTRYLRTHGVKANLEPYRKSGNMKPFVILSMSWVVMQGATVAESSGTPTGEVATGRSWGLWWDSGGNVNPLLAVWLLHRLRYNNGAADERSMFVDIREVFLIQIPLIFYLRLWSCWPKLFFLITLWETSSIVGIRCLPHLCLSLGFPDQRLESHSCHVSILSRISCMSLVVWVTKPRRLSASGRFGWRDLHLRF